MSGSDFKYPVLSREEAIEQLAIKMARYIGHGMAEKCLKHAEAVMELLADEPARIRMSVCSVAQTDHDKVTITLIDGEGGSFNLMDFEAAVLGFFRANF